MAYILDGMTLAMEGTPLALTEDGDYAIQPFALDTIGIVVCPLLELDEKLADPRTGRHRLWDRAYYRRKYERVLKSRDLLEPPPPVRSSVIQEALETEIATITADIASLELRALELTTKSTDQDTMARLVEIQEVTNWLVLARDRRRRQNNELAAITAVVMIYH
jgi:hypothetical protein